jgi:hypothetical protein
MVVSVYFRPRIIKKALQHNNLRLTYYTLSDAGGESA